MKGFESCNVSWCCSICRVNYIRLEVFHSIHPANSVTYIQQYLPDPNFVLIARTTYISLLSLDGVESMLSGSWGSGYNEGKGSNARYQWIAEIVPMNHELMLLSDKTNQVLRVLDLKTNKTSRYAGIPRISGQRDTIRLNAMLASPHGICKSLLEENTYYISNSQSHKVRRLNSTHVGTAYDGYPLVSPRGMAIDQVNPVNLYVVVSHGLVKVNLLTGHGMQLTSAATAGFKDGPFRTAMFSSPTSILQISTESFIVTDGGNNRLRLLDNENSTISSICTGKMLILLSCPQLVFAQVIFSLLCKRCAQLTILVIFWSQCIYFL